jgi:hypothetical protein
VKSSLHSLIPFLSFLLNHLRLPSLELEPILFQAHVPAGWRRSDSTTLLILLRLLFSTSSRLLTVPFYNSSARTPWKTPYSIVKEACLLVRYLAMDVLLLSRSRVLRKCVY